MRGRWLGQRLGYTKLLLTVSSFTREALFDELAVEPNQSGSTERHASTKFFGLWKSFFEKFLRRSFQPPRKISVK
ncbi:MAG: hypothetical protein AUG89_05405 [Acidobacteria bacterium 13_1_20CM_4_56_7]|jgi:hypothetical protein|nr:MAG: hypothetical protein AUG89_05405 [Acidobacteria bacterium 13_1_20CM_4_56_7]PYV49140.1 MAG: hypothetical protein DMG92_11820 [Acidobacteriota bacterium]